MIDNKHIQRVLKKAGYYTGKIDGDIGPKTRAAIADVLADNFDTSGSTVKAVQYVLVSQGVNVGKVDGLYGSMTQAAIEKYLGIKPWRPGTPSSGVSNHWPKYNDANRFFGRVGSNQTRLVTPYPMKLAWDTSKTITRFSIHQKCAPSAERVLKQTLDHYGMEGIRELGLDLFGGCLNVRKMRGGTRYSTHSWGAAIDFDPARNRLRAGRPEARLSSSDAVAFWEFWEKEGWVSLGRRKNYDWMHVQAIT